MPNVAEERRRHTRHKIERPVQATVRLRGETRSGATRDISAGGTAIDMGEDFDLAEGEVVELDIEDVGFMNAQLARQLDDGLAFKFIDMEEEDEEDLLADLARLDESIRDEEF